MNWDAIAAVGEIVGALAVIVTLLYLARQIRQSNRQNLLDAFQHTYDSMNGWCTLLSESPDLTQIMVRGRSSYEELEEPDRLRFEFVHFHLLNIVESHLYQAQQTSLDEEYRTWAIENMKGVVKGYFGFPGTRKFWSIVEPFYRPEIRKLVSSQLESVETPSIASDDTT